MKNLAIPVTFKNKIRLGREIGNGTGKTGNGKVHFSRTGKNREQEKDIFPGNGKDHFPVPVPVHAYREREKIIFTVTGKRIFSGTGKGKTIFPFPSMPI